MLESKYFLHAGTPGLSGVMLKLLEQKYANCEISGKNTIFPSVDLCNKYVTTDY